METERTNPFRPSTGANPPELLGRESILEDFEDSLVNGPGAPDRLLRITGSQGTGKTVLLAALGDCARHYHWRVLDETATTGFTVRLIERLKSLKASENTDAATDIDARINTETGLLELPRLSRHEAIGSTTSSDAAARAHTETYSAEFNTALLPLALRETLSDATHSISAHTPDAGLLITLDETQGAPIEELRSLAIAVQHLIGEDQNIALALAGLPGMNSKTIHDGVISFTRRATPVALSDVPLDAARESFADLFSRAGFTVDNDALDLITNATHGYPYMVQLVGYNAWQQAQNGGILDVARARRSVDAAIIRLGDAVLEPAMKDLAKDSSKVGITFLLAMAQDDGPSRTADIAARLKRTPGYVARYRQRLLDAGIIQAQSYGYVDFTIPYLRQWLQQHAATLVMQSQQEAHE
ncbi:MAG: hypothetical protein PUF51_01475 [Bifidobacteriaceae bacterium]|nr:hypothetical protein [Bifidobacteriaceae bacterium]